MFNIPYDENSVPDISTLTASLYDCRGIAQELLKKAERERRKAAAV